MAFNQSEYNSTYISTATSTQVFTGKGILHNIVLGETAAGAITIADGTSASSTTKGVLKASIIEGVYEFDGTMANGLYITTAAASKLTVNWAQA